MTDLEILRGMDALFEERGWCQGMSWSGGDGSRENAECYCLTGAAECVVLGIDEDCYGAECDALVDCVAYKVVRAAGGLLDQGRSVAMPWQHYGIDWNDAEGRTKAEVVAAIRKAIELEVAA